MGERGRAICFTIMMCFFMACCTATAIWGS